MHQDSNSDWTWLWVLLLILFLIVIAVWIGSAWNNNVSISPQAVAESPNVLNVTLVTKDMSHPWYGQGSDLGFAINGVQGAPLNLKAGQNYVWNISTPGHPFYFSTSNVGNSNGQGNIAVPGTPIEMGSFTWTPTVTTQQPLFYQCATHQYMGGQVFITQ